MLYEVITYDTWKNQAHASKVLDMHSVGVIHKIVFETTKIPFNQITSRLLDLLLQNVELSFKEKKHSGDVKTLLFYSNQDKEGKTVVAGNVALHLRDMGKRVVFINFTSHSPSDNLNRPNRITSYNVCYTKLLRLRMWMLWRCRSIA